MNNKTVKTQIWLHLINLVNILIMGKVFKIINGYGKCYRLNHLLGYYANTCLLYL